MKSPLWALRQFWCLGSSDRILVTVAPATLLVTVIRMRLSGYRRGHIWMARLIGSTSIYPLSATEQTIRQHIRFFWLAVRYHPLPGSCLPQPLTLWWLLYRQGLACKLQSSTRQQNGRVEAHIWVEYAGHGLNESQNVRSRFLPFSNPILRAESIFL